MNWVCMSVSVFQGRNLTLTQTKECDRTLAQKHLIFYNDALNCSIFSIYSINNNLALDQILIEVT